MVAIYLIVLTRYRNLIPLMYLLFMAEVLLRIAAASLHPLTPDYYARTPPGAIANIPSFVYAGVMLTLALRSSRAAGAGELGEPVVARS
jgi:hypothetical protein